MAQSQIEAEQDLQKFLKGGSSVAALDDSRSENLTPTPDKLTSMGRADQMMSLVQNQQINPLSMLLKKK
jgi:hypothetical protein